VGAVTWVWVGFAGGFGCVFAGVVVVVQPATSASAMHITTIRVAFLMSIISPILPFRGVPSSLWRNIYFTPEIIFCNMAVISSRGSIIYERVAGGNNHRFLMSSGNTFRYDKDISSFIERSFYSRSVTVSHDGGTKTERVI
jgi:hypothetical protein